MRTFALATRFQPLVLHTLRHIRIRRRQKTAVVGGNRLGSMIPQQSIINAVEGSSNCSKQFQMKIASGRDRAGE
jgi:hypothetical protein